MTPSFFVPLESEAEVSDQILSIWRTRSFLPTLALAALWNMYTDAPGTCTQMLTMWLRGEGWVAKR